MDFRVNEGFYEDLVDEGLLLATVADADHELRHGVDEVTEERERERSLGERGSGVLASADAL